MEYKKQQSKLKWFTFEQGLHGGYSETSSLCLMYALCGCVPIGKGNK